ncbi:MAG TPA: C-terminal binding protein [Firmicutes bacterium]|nr:C-terminal binding protein [Bacillota bacterium]
MERTIVAVTDYIEPDLMWEEEQLARLGVKLMAYQLKFAPPEELLSKVKDADVLVVNMARMNGEVIGGLRRCRLIIRHGVGYDNVDVAAATRKGIMVSYVPDYCLEEVAEHTIALMMACVRRLFQGRKVLEDSARRGSWDFEPLVPTFRLMGKTVGIVGCGRIGSRVLRRLSGFGVRTIVCDPYLPEERRRELGVPFVDLEALLSESDVVTLHVPLNSETYHMISEPQLRAMKPTAYLVNTSRGPVVDTKALARALREGWIAGAGIDVYEREPPEPGEELLSLPNAVLSPHISWYSEESAWDIRVKIVEDIRRFCEGKPPRFLVNPEVLQRRGT